MVLKMLEQLEKNSLLNMALVMIYGTALIFLHDFFVQLSVKTMNNLSLTVYNKVVLVISIVSGILVLIFLLRKLYRKKEERGKKIFFCLATLSLIALHYRFLFEMNIEVIHVAEFMLLSVFLFPLCGSFGGAVIFTLPFIFVNEWYQYVVLYPDYIRYFEFNDVVVDLLGCGLAMIFLWISGVEEKQNRVSYFKNPEIIFLVGINVLFVVLLVTCVFVLYPGNTCENTFLVLNRLENPHLFWQRHVYGAMYHVMKPIEGMIAMNVLCLFFGGVRSEKK